MYKNLKWHKYQDGHLTTVKISAYMQLALAFEGTFVYNLVVFVSSKLMFSALFASLTQSLHRKTLKETDTGILLSTVLCLLIFFSKAHLMQTDRRKSWVQENGRISQHHHEEGQGEEDMCEWEHLLWLLSNSGGWRKSAGKKRSPRNNQRGQESHPSLHD